MEKKYKKCLIFFIVLLMILIIIKNFIRVERYKNWNELFTYYITLKSKGSTPEPEPTPPNKWNCISNSCMASSNGSFSDYESCYKYCKSTSNCYKSPNQISSNMLPSLNSLSISQYMNKSNNSVGKFICGLPKRYSQEQYNYCFKNYNLNSLTTVDQDIKTTSTGGFKPEDVKCIKNLALNCGIMQGINSMIRSNNQNTLFNNINYIKNNPIGMNFNLELLPGCTTSRIYAPNTISSSYPWKDQMKWNVADSPNWNGYTYAYGEELDGTNTLKICHNPKLFSTTNSFKISELFNNTSYTNNTFNTNTTSSTSDIPSLIPGYEINIRDMNDTTTTKSTHGTVSTISNSTQSQYRMLYINNLSTQSVFAYFRTSDQFDTAFKSTHNWSFTNNPEYKIDNIPDESSKVWVVPKKGYTNGFVFTVIPKKKYIKLILPLIHNTVSYDKNIPKPIADYVLSSINLSFYKNIPQVLCDWKFNHLNGAYTSNATLFEATFQSKNKSITDYIDLSVIPGGSCGGHVNPNFSLTNNGPPSVNTGPTCYNNIFAIDLNNSKTTEVCGYDYNNKMCGANSKNKCKNNTTDCGLINRTYTNKKIPSYPPLISCTPGYDANCLNKTCSNNSVCSITNHICSSLESVNNVKWKDCNPFKQEDSCVTNSNKPHFGCMLDYVTFCKNKKSYNGINWIPYTSGKGLNSIDGCMLDFTSYCNNKHTTKPCPPKSNYSCTNTGSLTNCKDLVSNSTYGTQGCEICP